MIHNTRKYLVASILIFVIFLPRITLLTNGLDSQRIWDTNTPAAFRFLDAIQHRTLGGFFASDEKYPLLGSYIYVPAISAYYGVGRLAGWFHNATDFVNAYALGETRLFFWLRLEMFFINLAALYLLYHLTKKFSQAKQAAYYVIALAAVNFYVTMFSVTPRIHSLSFATTTLALYASFHLLREKSWPRYVAAFGAAAVAASVSQAGFAAFVIPVLAHFYHSKKERFLFSITRPFIGAVGLSLALALLLGYPRVFAAITDPHISLREVFLSAEHTQPTLGFAPLVGFIRSYVFSELLPLWFLLIGGWYLWCSKRKERMSFSPEDWLCVAHLAIFFLLFGFSGALTGRFTLAILPSFFFIASKVMIHLERRRLLFGITILFLAIQAYGIGQLAAIAFRNDTRTKAAEFVLGATEPGQPILGTLDPILLGVTPAPHTILRGEAGPVGGTEQIIADRDLIGEKTRQYRLWNPQEDAVTNSMVGSYQYAVVSADHPYAYRAEELLLQNGFTPVEIFSNQKNGDRKNQSSIPWDQVTPPTRLPLPIALRKFKAFGPTMVVYERSE